MAINRYSTLTPSQFKPLSMEEIMLVPSMKRKQHDQLLANQESIHQKLAEVDPLDVHREEAIKLREEINNRLNQQALELAQQGINPNSQANFLSLNRDYQNLTGPSGRIGQINAAKKIYAENFKNYLEDATKNKKWSRELALENWYKNHHNKYTGYNDENDIVNIDQYGAPEKVELMSKLKDVKSILGEQVVNEISAGNYSIAPGPNGSMQIVNRNGRRIETSNAPNIQNALNMLSSELYDPNSNWNKSLLFEGRTPEQMLRVSKDGKAYEGELMSGLNTMLNTKVTDNRNKNLSLSGYKNQADWDEQKAKGQLIETTSSFLPHEFAVNDFKFNQSKLNNLLNKQKNNTLTKEDSVELEKLNSFQKTLNERLNKDKQYNSLNTDIKQLIDSSTLSEELKDKLKKAEFINTSFAGISGRNRTIYLGDKLTVITPQELIEVNKIESKLNSNLKTKREIENNYTKENTVMTTGYSMLPTTTKEQSTYKVFNNSFFQALKDPQALRKYLNIETVDVDGQNVKPTNNDKEKLAQLYTKYGTEGQVLNMIPKDFNGKPGYIIEFKTGDNSYNMDGLGKGSVGGSDGIVRMKVTFNKEYGNVLGNVNHYALKYFEDKGEINPETNLPVGYDLANEARKNMYSYTSYNDVFQDPNYNWQNDELVRTNMYKTIKKSLQDEGSKSPFSGVNPEKYLEIFLNRYGDKFIEK